MAGDLHPRGEVTAVFAVLADRLAHTIDLIVSCTNNQGPLTLTLGLAIRLRNHLRTVRPGNFADGSHPFKPFEAARRIPPQFLDCVAIVCDSPPLHLREGNALESRLTFQYA